MNLAIPGLDLKPLAWLVFDLPRFERKPFAVVEFRESVGEFMSKVAICAADPAPEANAQVACMELFGPAGKLLLDSFWVTAADAESCYSELLDGDLSKLNTFPSGFFNEQLDRAFLSIAPKYQFIDSNSKPPQQAVDSFSFSEVIAGAFDQINRARCQDKLEKLFDEWTRRLGVKKTVERSGDYLLAFRPIDGGWTAFFTSIAGKTTHISDSLVLGVAITFKAE